VFGHVASAATLWRTIQAAGLSEPSSVLFHTLRHTAASQWIRAGVEIFTVSRRLGHSKAGFTTDVYSHLLAGRQRHVAEALDHLLP
jgi:integrase